MPLAYLKTSGDFYLGIDKSNTCQRKTNSSGDPVKNAKKNIFEIWLEQSYMKNIAIVAKIKTNGFNKILNGTRRR